MKKKLDGIQWKISPFIAFSLSFISGPTCRIEGGRLHFILSSDQKNGEDPFPSARDREEFSLECRDLLEKGIIRLSKSPHAAPAFYVENNNEIKRGK